MLENFQPDEWNRNLLARENWLEEKDNQIDTVKDMDMDVSGTVSNFVNQHEASS